MIDKIYPKLNRNYPFNSFIRRLFWKLWYQYIEGHCVQQDWAFLNYGYAPLDTKTEKLELDEADEPNRAHIQLYHHVVNTIPKGFRCVRGKLWARRRIVLYQTLFKTKNNGRG